MQQGAFCLEGNYGVYLGKEACGKVQVLRQGLYYRFLCRCRFRCEGICRLQVSCGGKQTDLGILVPVEEGFGLDRKIPVKHFGEGNPEFRICLNQRVKEERFVPICPEEPFAYIAKLKDAYLVHRNGQAGILIEKADAV